MTARSYWPPMNADERGFLDSLTGLGHYAGQGLRPCDIALLRETTPSRSWLSSDGAQFRAVSVSERFGGGTESHGQGPSGAVSAAAAASGAGIRSGKTSGECRARIPLGRCQAPSRPPWCPGGSHDRPAPAEGGIVEIRGPDAQRHAKDAGGVERLPAGVLPGDGDATQRIRDARQKPGLRTFAEITGTLMKQAGEYGVAKEILGSEIAHGRAESLGISRAAFAILGRLVVRLRKPGAKRLGVDVERIAVAGVALLTVW